MDTHEHIRQAFVACVSGEVRAWWVRGRPSMPARRRGARMGVVVMVVPLLGLALAGSASAFNYVVDANGTYWGIQDAAPPRVDTGSVRATQVGPGRTAALQHDAQRLRRHQGPGADDTGAALQRRADARLRPALRRRRSLHDDPVGRPRRRHHLALGVRQPQRELGALARHVHQHDERAADDQGRLRRPVGHGRVRRQLERDRQHVQRRRPGHRGRLVGRGRHAAVGHDAGRRPAGDGDRHAASPFARRDDLRRQLALRHLQQPARRTPATRATSRAT